MIHPGQVTLLAAAQVGDVVPARAQMAATLGFHIILACLGIALPSIVLLAEFVGLRRGNEVARRLARRWSQAMGVLVAVGAVTGTVLSFEMGLLWPGLMRQYGAVLGLPFGLEGIFFFLEAIFTGIYLWSWDRLPPWAHWWSGVPIAVSGIFGAMSVVAVNAWMNQPGGFTQRGGQITSVDPWQVFFNHAASYEMPHMILAAYMIAGFTVAGIYAAGILHGRRDRYHYTGFALGFVPAAVLTPLQMFLGDTAARAIAHDQPVKFAAMEYVPQTSRQVPEWLAGVYVNGRIYGGIKIPSRDSLLVGFGPGTKVTGRFAQWVHRRAAPRRHDRLAACPERGDRRVRRGRRGGADRELAVCATNCGPGGLHLINGLFDANRSGVPVLAIVSHIPSVEIGGEYFQETHPQELFRECSVYCEMAGVPEQLPWMLEMAMRAVLQRRGVTVVVVPGDVFLHEAPRDAEPSPVRAAPAVVRPDDESLTVAARC